MAGVWTCVVRIRSSAHLGHRWDEMRIIRKSINWEKQRDEEISIPSLDRNNSCRVYAVSDYQHDDRIPYDRLL